MASVTFFTATNMASRQVWLGSLTGSTGTDITITDGYNTGIYHGQFSYSTSGNVFGTLTGYTEYRGSTAVSDMSGFAIDASTASSLISANQLQSLFPVVLSSSDFMNGSSSTDVLLTYNGNDFIRGGGGNDTIDGGAGIDTTVLRGSAAQFTVNRTSATGAQVTDNVAGRDGIDTLFNIERLHFTDKTVALDVEGNAGQAYRLYQAAFARTPDQGGLTWHVNQLDNGKSLHDDAMIFLGSPEFAGRYGANPSDQAFVTALYQNVLGRGPDAGGEAYWVGHLADHSLDRATVLMNFSESVENKGLVGIQIANGIMLDNLV